MDEKEILKGNMSFLKRIKVISIIITGITILLWAFWFVINDYFWKHHSGFYSGYREAKYMLFGKPHTIYRYQVRDIGVAAIVLSGIAIIFLIYYFYCSKMNLTVTNKRIYGKTAFGRRVDLPIDMISAVGTRVFKGITVSTSSGIISFLGISNQEEVHKAITDLLMERQNKPKPTTQIKQEIPQSNADELKKYKELLDSGIITQEEFDAKKKQLLGL